MGENLAAGITWLSAVMSSLPTALSVKGSFTYHYCWKNNMYSLSPFNVRL